MILTRMLFLITIFITSLISQTIPQMHTFGFQDMFRVKKASNPQLSPSAKFVLFEISAADSAINKWKRQIWRVSTTDKQIVQMTRREMGASQPKWAKTDDHFYFISKQGQYNNIFSMSNFGGEAEPIFTHPAHISKYEISADGNFLYFLAEDSLTKKEIANNKIKADAYFVDHQEKAVQLWQFDILRKKKTQLTQGDYSVREFSVSNTGKQIAFVAAPTPREDDYLKREIYLHNLASGTEQKLTENNIAEYSLKWTPQENSLTFRSDSNSELETYYQDSIFLLDISSRLIHDLLPDFKYQVFDYFWTQDGRKIVLSANTGVNTQLFLLDRRRGGTRQLTTVKQDIRYLNYNSEQNQFVYLQSTPHRPYDVFISSPENIPGKRITEINSWLGTYHLADYKTITWKSPDGKEVEGILISPKNRSNKPIPLIVQLHGGPESSYRNYFGSRWSTYPQIWAAHGYAVFQPNYRGSTGYGDDVMRAIIGHYFEKDIDDIISGIDYLVKEKIADPQHMACMGWSAGGHLTNWLVTHFQRFKAACSGAGGANWYSFYAQTDVQYIREIWHVGPPYLRRDYYLQKSPVTYAKNAKTPVLFLCGEKDRRVPYPQSLEMYRALKRFGCETKMIGFPREGHGLKELNHQLFKMQSEFQWIEKHLFNRDWEIEDLK